MRKIAITIVAGMLMMGLMAAPAPAQKDVTLTVTWAAWYPADYLIKLSDEFTRENPNIKLKGAFIPWPMYHDRVFTEFASLKPAFDIVVPDSQWIGEAVEGGHLLELTDWVKENINFDDWYEFPLRSYGEYPDYSDHWYGVPLLLDFVLIAYRKDLFNDPKEKAEFKEKYGYELDVPKTWQELLDIARFFTRPEKNLYGFATWQAPLATAGLADIFLGPFWSIGGNLWDPRTKRVQGIINNWYGIDAAKLWVDLFKTHPPGSASYSIDEVMTAFQQGLISMAAMYAMFYPGLLDPSLSLYAEQTGFFTEPGAIGHDGVFRHFVQLGGQGLAVSAYTPHKEEALKFIKWAAADEFQWKWTEGGNFTAKRTIIEDPAYLERFPVAEIAQVVRESAPRLRDFWEIPQYTEMGEYLSIQLNQAILGKITPEEAMDRIAKRHEEILKRAGYYK
jgi:multiple sugar transport system substrate-binding protein